MLTWIFLAKEVMIRWGMFGATCGWLCLELTCSQCQHDHPTSQNHELATRPTNQPPSTMKFSSATLSVAVLAVAFFVSSEATTNSSTAVCNTFVTCASCACSTYSYSLKDECNSGCAWLPDTQSCVTAEEAQASGDTAFYSLFVGNPTLPEESLRDEWLRAGRTTCEVGTVTGPIVSVCIMGVMATLSVIGGVCAVRRVRKLHRGAQGGTHHWLIEELRAHLVPSDTLLWVGVANSPDKPSGDHFSEEGIMVLSALLIVGFAVPSIVWLCIGLPMELESDWEFAFYYPVYFVGGMAAVGFMILQPAMHRDPSYRMISAYALTDKRAVVVSGDLVHKELGKRGKVSSYAVGAVSYVRVIGGDTIEFGARANTTVAFTGTADAGNGAGSGADPKSQQPPLSSELMQRSAQMSGSGPSIKVRFENLPTTGPIFRLLQSMVGMDMAVIAQRHGRGRAGSATAWANVLPTAGRVHLADVLSDGGSADSGTVLVQAQPAGSRHAGHDPAADAHVNLGIELI